MQKLMRMNRLVMAVGLVGSLGFVSGSVQAADFGVTSEVQNTLAVTVVQDMNLGTLFATSASSAVVGSLSLSPDGTIEAVDEDLPLLSLGGQAAGRGSVATDQNFFVVVPESTETTPGSIHDSTDVVEVQITNAQGDPGDPSIARFYLVNFTIGDLVDGALVSPAADGNSTPGAAAEVNPDFGVAGVEFGIGADIYTDDSGARTGYETGTYSGTFVVEAEFR